MYFLFLNYTEKKVEVHEIITLMRYNLASDGKPMHCDQTKKLKVRLCGESLPGGNEAWTAIMDLYSVDRLGMNDFAQAVGLFNLMDHIIGYK